MGKNNKQQPMKRFQRFGIRKFNQGVASVMIASGMFFLAGGMVSADEVTPSKATETIAVAEKKEEVVNAEKQEATTAKKEEAAIVGKQEVAPKKEEATNRQTIVEKSKKEILKASIETLEEKLKSAQEADPTAVQTAREVLAAAKPVLSNESATLEEINAQIEAVTALSTVITEAKAQAFDKKLEEKKAEEIKAKEENATTKEKEVEAVKTQLTQVASEAEVTNTLANTEASKKEVNKEAKVAIEKAVVANAEALKLAKEVLANKNATKAQIDNSLAQLDTSIKAVYSQLENAGAKRNGKFEVNLAEEQASSLKDASTETGKKWLEDHGYGSLSDIKVKTKEDNLKEIKDLNDQIQWLDFGDTAAWTNLTASNQLQIGSTYRKELIPGYIVTMTVKELKPFESTETFKNRVAGTDLENTYQPDKENKFNPENNGATGLGANPQNGYTHVNNAGLSTGSSKTTIAGTNPQGQPKNGQAAGVKFDVTATYNGKPVKPGIVMTSGEDIGPLESEIYTTNGTPWDLAAIVGYKTNKKAYVPLDQFKDMNGGKAGISKWNDEKFIAALNGGKFATPDAATAGLGSQVFGGYRNNGGSGTPVLSTANVTEVGLYIMSSGQQSSMIGIKFSDFGDLPESYGMAEHFLRTETVDYLTKQKKQIQQPFLGKVKADIDSAPGTRVRGVDSDDMKDTGDEGVDQLISEEHVHTNVDTGQPEVKFIQGPDNTYKVKLYASANGNDKYTDTVAPAYVRGFIDFNGNGKFDEGEQSNIVQVNGNNQLVELTFTNTQVIDTSKDVVNFRVRIAKDEAQVERSNGIAYSGEVEDNQIQVAHPPRGDKEETTGKQGETQSVGIEFKTHPSGEKATDLGSNNGKTTFNSYGKIHYTEQSNVISAETTKKVQSEGVMIVNPDGTLTKTYTKAGQGTYTVTDDKVTFTPEASFVGKADGIVLRAVDSNGQSTGWTALTNQNQLENINDGTHSAGATKTMDAVYIPTVTPKEITANPETSTDIQGKEQKKTPTFKTEGASETDPAVTPSATYPAKLVDPKTNTKVDSVTVEGEGTYTINPTTGEVTFQPLPTFKGTATGVDVTLTAPVGQNKDGQDVTATATTKYTPTVTAVTPTAKPSDSAGVQGETQKGTPTFTEGNAEVPIKENSVKLLNADGTEANGPVNALDEKGNKVGEYTVNPATGEVTFTPTDKTYTGKVVPAKVQAEDKNGTKVNTTYTPHIVGVTPSATPAQSSGIQGQPQDGTVSFAPGETTVEGEKKSVPIKDNSAVLLDASGNPVAPGTPIDALDPEGNKVGEYTIDPATNKVTFTPTNKEYKGKVQPANVQAEDENGTKVKTTYTPSIVGVTPTATPSETTDVQGVEQSKEVTFKPGKATVNGVEKEVPIDTTSFKLLDEKGQPAESVPAKNPAGDVIGTYTLKVVDGKPTAVFTPTDKTYAGEVEPVTIQAKDTNGTPVTTTYTPSITPVEPTGTPKSTEGAQGQPQEGTPTFTAGTTKVNGKTVTVPIDENVAPTLEGADKEGKVVVPGEGTYTIDKNGKVTFTPEPDFVGTTTGVTVKRVDENGTPVTATYTPTVLGKVTTENVVSEGAKGQPQSNTPVFKGDVDTTVAPTFKDGSTEKKVPGEGTYTIDKDGKVTFTPEENFVGTATPVEVVRKDKNGKTIKASYTPTVRPDTKFVVVGKDGKETELLPSKDGKNPSETIPGYKLVKTETDEKGNTKHIYEPVTTKHVDRNGNPIPGTTTEEGTKDPKNIPGYKVVETRKLPNGDTEYVYEKVTTRYVDQAGHPIPGTEIEEGTKEPKNIPGYKLVSTTTSGEGDTVHTYAPVQTFFKDKDGNVIPGTTTEDGEQPKKDIPGYKFVETKKLPNGDTEHVYEKVTTPTPAPTPAPVPSPATPAREQVLTTYVDENGELIIPNENGSHPGKELKGYEIVRTEKDANGNVRNVYRKVTPVTPEAKVMTTFVDENGNVIIPNENGEVPAKEISEYELVRTEKDANGNVRHIYRKVVAPAPKAVKTTPAKQEKVTRQELPNTGTGQETAFLGAAASAILAGLGLVTPKRNKKDEE